MHEQLIKDISIKYKTQTQDIELCKKFFRPVLMPKSRILEEDGKIPQYLYYIVSGFMRLFYYDDSGDEVTIHINCPHGFFTSFSEFTNQTKASANVETITECQELGFNPKPSRQALKSALVYMWEERQRLLK